ESLIQSRKPKVTLDEVLFFLQRHQAEALEFLLLPRSRARAGKRLKRINPGCRKIGTERFEPTDESRADLRLVFAVEIDAITENPAIERADKGRGIKAPLDAVTRAKHHGRGILGRPPAPEVGGGGARKRNKAGLVERLEL